MPHASLIEIDGRAVGLVTRDDENRHFRFHAAVPEAFPLDGGRFRSPEQALRAVRNLLRPGPGQALKDLPLAA